MMTLSDRLKKLPSQPGVYLFKNSSGEVIYVGKAKNLKNRVKTYFQNGNGRLLRTELMVREIADLEFRIVSSEIESLILENLLIKQYRPKYNIRLRDDKNYQFIKLDYQTEIPQIYTVRKLSDSEHSDGIRPPAGEAGKLGSHPKYFGPYTSGLSVKNTLYLLKRVFRLCRNKKISAKPCFAFHLGRCPGVCIGQISLAQYRETFAQIEDFLAHRQTAVLRELREEMKTAAREKRFEKAAAARNKIRSLEHLWEKQKIISTKNTYQDFIGVYQTRGEAVTTLLQVRGGKLLGQENFMIEHKNSDEAEILEKFLLQYYEDVSDIPKEIFLPCVLRNATLLQKALSKLKRAPVTILCPVRGKKKKLVKLAQENAKMFFEHSQASFESGMVNALPELQKLLQLPAIPFRIEGYDISNIQGTTPVGSMVVFVEGRPAKSQYRKFKIKTIETPNDYAMMKEILGRRLKHGSTSPRPSPGLGRVAEGRERSQSWPLPDLIVIDGGKGQLNAALSALQNQNLKSKIQILGLAKRLEEIFVPRQKHPIILPPNSPILFLLQQIRDEAHRFAVTFHRTRRGKLQTASRLDAIPGVGQPTRKKLIKKFGSTAALKKISLESLAREVGLKLAKKIKEQI